MNVYKISLDGCDDSTVVYVENLSEQDISLLQRLEVLFMDTSTYGCMPTMSVYEIDQEEYAKAKKRREEQEQEEKEIERAERMRF